MPKKDLPPKRFPWYMQSWHRILFLIVLMLFFLGYPGQNTYTISMMSGETQKVGTLLPIPVPAPYPENMTGIYPGDEITANGVVVYDQKSGVYLYKRNEQIELAPASTTKILTALVALDAFDLGDIVTVGDVVDTGQVMGLVPGERITVENLLFGTLVHSGNDAAYALAAHYPDGVDAFVRAMNQKAAALGLLHSTFTNPVGFDDPSHKMTPMDLVKLAQAGLADTTIAKMVAIPQITVSDVTHTYFHPLTNINELLGKIPGVGGIKTGWTEEAGENLVTLVERNGHTLIFVVLKSQDRFQDTVSLIDWVFANYKWISYEAPSQ